jgi:peptidoglycan/LPS O-acetylase OafA/YrhL
VSLVIHCLLFLAITAPIVVLSAFHADAEDAPAFRSIPKRAWHFVFGCAVLAGVLIACEHLFGSVH